MSLFDNDVFQAENSALNFGSPGNCVSMLPGFSNFLGSGSGLFELE